VSFKVAEGEIFGLLGPNGAGKTTAIRLMLDIFKPDQGQISLLGGSMSEAKKDRIGYMPEERGLYQDIPLERVLVYLANLKSVPTAVARQRVGEYLERFDLAAYRHKKVKELSKGMQQKAQIIATLLHQPELVIIDEPFSGLDPLNTQMVKDLMRELRQGGTTIIMSTHQMHQVEELCERLVLVNHGRVVLYGGLEQIRRPFTGHAVLVRCAGALPPLSGIESIETHNAAVRLNLSSTVTPQQVLGELLRQGATIEQFEVATPSLDEIFIQVVSSPSAPTRAEAGLEAETDIATGAGSVALKDPAEGADLDAGASP
jgi:ABC-2 type transport system ATP-binding protein